MDCDLSIVFVPTVTQTNKVASSSAMDLKNFQLCPQDMIDESDINNSDFFHINASCHSFIMSQLYCNYAFFYYSTE